MVLSPAEEVDMKTVALDFETHDPYIKEGLGAGWPFYKEGRLKVLCSCVSTDEEVAVVVSLHDLKDVISNADVIVCHNAQYDIGLLHALGIPYKDKLIVDTIILAKLVDNTRMSYSLDSIAQTYLGERKTKDTLGSLALDLGLVKTRQNPDKVAMENMETLYSKRPELVEKYCMQDTSLTYRLYKHLTQLLPNVDLVFYSDLLKSVIVARSKGVRVCRSRAVEVLNKLVPERDRFKEEVVGIMSKFILDKEPNPNSSQQLAETLTGLGMKLPETDKGSLSTKSDVLESVDHPFVDNLLRYRKHEKIIRDFVEPIAEGGRDRVYPEVTLLGARTGRPTCARPNLYQIPKRDGELSLLVRSIYMPEEGHQWASLDFSTQEPRLAIHFAAQLGIPSAVGIAKKLKIHADLDLHEEAAKLLYDVPKPTKAQRNAAKTIGLGLMYGMGRIKLGQSLKLGKIEARKLLNEYFTKVPYIYQMSELCKTLMVKRKYLTTLGGRKARFSGASHKSLNELIQGSAADQTYACLVRMYREGIDYMFSVYDSIELSVPDMETVKKAKEIMETSVSLLVPTKTDAEIGDSWGTLTKVKL